MAVALLLGAPAGAGGIFAATHCMDRENPLALEWVAGASIGIMVVMAIELIGAIPPGHR
jgi:hypothetical protein